MDWDNDPPFGIASAQVLFEQFLALCDENTSLVELKITLSKQRVTDAFNAWKEDTRRNKKNFQSTDTSVPDHVKCAAILTYWIRRERTVTSVDHFAIGGMYSPLEQLQIEVVHEGSDESLWTALTESEIAELKIGDFTAEQFISHRRRLQAYGNEYLAFDFGFRLAREYEIAKRKELGLNADILSPDVEFIDDLCYFLKFKSVSPHAIFCIYQALLMRR